MINAYLTDPCTNAKLILTDVLIKINIYLYLTAAYQYLINVYNIKPIFLFNWPLPLFNQWLQTCNSKTDHYLNRGLVSKFKIHWIVLKFLAHIRKLQDTGLTNLGSSFEEKALGYTQLNGEIINMLPTKFL